MADYLTFSGDAVNLNWSPTTFTFTETPPISVTIKFRTSHTATRGMLWSDRDGGTGREYFLDINHSGVSAGFMRFVGFDGGSTFFVPDSGASMADGAYHVVTLVRESATLHRWFIDGAQVGSDITSSIGTSAATDRSLGYYAGGGLSFTGDIEWIVFHDEAISLADHQAMSSGDSPILIDSVKRNYYACGPAAAENFNNDHLDLVFVAALADTRRNATVTTNPDAVSDGGPAHLTATSASPSAVFRISELVEPGAAAASDEVIREIGNVYTADDGDLVMIYTGHPAASGNNTQLHYASSDDGGATWTKEGVLISQATHGIYTEDGYCYFDGTTYWLLCENKSASGGTHAGIALFSSANGKTSWTLEDADILALGAGGSWDDQDVSSPVMWKEGATYYLLYEGRGNGDDGAIGLATASSPTGTWTKDAGNPVLDHSGASDWYHASIVPDDVKKVGSTYHLLAHGADSIGGYRCGVFESSNLTSWSQPSDHANPVTTELCNTLMYANFAGTELIGADESGTFQYSIMGYGAYVPTPSVAAGGGQLIDGGLVDAGLVNMGLIGG